jgi:hypothetical protein
VNRHQADLNGLAGGSAVAIIGGISVILVGAVFLVAVVYIRGSAPDIRPRCQSGISRSVSLSLDPIQSQQWLYCLRRASVASVSLEANLPAYLGGSLCNKPSKRDLFGALCLLLPKAFVEGSDIGPTQP